jgi:S1-C subfamily serine protease
MQSGGGAAAGLSKNAKRRANKKKKQQLSDKGDVKSEDDGEAVAEALQLPIDSVVKVFATLTAVSYCEPWTIEPPEDVSGSGFVIESGGRKLIVTNAHVVANASL